MRLPNHLKQRENRTSIVGTPIPMALKDQLRKEARKQGLPFCQFIFNVLSGHMAKINEASDLSIRSKRKDA